MQQISSRSRLTKQLSQKFQIQSYINTHLKQKMNEIPTKRAHFYAPVHSGSDATTNQMCDFAIRPALT